MLYKKETIVGVVGMGVMGRNLALNMVNKGYRVAIFNRSNEKTHAVIVNNASKYLVPFYSLKEFIYSLKKPRTIFLMITAGKHVDQFIEKLSFHLESGDIIIDGGNSFYKDTMSRDIFLSKKGINFIGIGISGGEEGALQGPSLMPGCRKDVYVLVEPILKKIAAQIDQEMCVTYIGPNGSGHYVKMIHNGIEYGEMQLISEVYSFLKKILCFTNEKLEEIFRIWNRGELSSYLLEITGDIIIKKDINNCYVINSILDIADSKGTGSWASQSALDLEIPCNMMTESVFVRYLSVLKEQRIQASKSLVGPKYQCCIENKELFVEQVRKALYFSKIILYSQEFYQLKIASDKYHWNLNYKEIAKIFRAGCIIRSSFLNKIIDIYSQTPNIPNLLLSKYCVDILNNYQKMLREVVICAVKHGVSMPTFSAALSYYDNFRSEFLPTNLIQAQRDYFGSHTYRRIDQRGIFHTKWGL